MSSQRFLRTKPLFLSPLRFPRKQNTSVLLHHAASRHHITGIWISHVHGFHGSKSTASREKEERPDVCFSSTLFTLPSSLCSPKRSPRSSRWQEREKDLIRILSPVYLFPGLTIHAPIWAQFFRRRLSSVSRAREDEGAILTRSRSLLCDDDVALGSHRKGRCFGGPAPGESDAASLPPRFDHCRLRFLSVLRRCRDPPPRSSGCSDQRGPSRTQGQRTRTSNRAPVKHMIQGRLFEITRSPDRAEGQLFSLRSPFVLVGDDNSLEDLPEVLEVAAKRLALRLPRQSPPTKTLVKVVSPKGEFKKWSREPVTSGRFLLEEGSGGRARGPGGEDGGRDSKLDPGSQEKISRKRLLGRTQREEYTIKALIPVC